MIRKRAPWLIVLFLSEMLTTTTMGFFQDEIARAVVLALFLPLIISSGGNSGSQATTLVIRAMAVGEVSLSGELRRVPRLDARLREAAQLGFKRAGFPRAQAADAEGCGLQPVPLTSVREAFDALLGEKVAAPRPAGDDSGGARA